MPVRTRVVVTAALVALGLAVCLVWPTTLDAQKRPPKLQVYHDETAFLGDVGEVVVQGFESYPTYVCTEGGPEPFEMLVSDSFTVTIDPLNGGTAFLCTGTAEGGPTPVEGHNALVAGSMTLDGYRLAFTITNQRPLYAVGFYIKDGAETGALTFTVDGEPITIAPCCQAEGNVLFFGVVGHKPIRAFSVTSTGRADGLALDKLTLAFRGGSK